jgi:hypothetical protein
MKYDYFIAGRWRNHLAIREIVEKLRATGKTAYCFIENEYEGDGIHFKNDVNADVEKMMQTTEQLENWKTNKTFNEIFEADMDALKGSQALVLVFPAGLSAHMELGAAYGMGKKCYGIGKVGKNETLYKMFDDLYENVDQFMGARK